MFYKSINFCKEFLKHNEAAFKKIKKVLRQEQLIYK
jgi:hypothetical protein